MAVPKLIIDTDPGVDDILAIIFALASKEVQLQALTLTFGNTDLEYTRANILRLAAVLKKHLAANAPGAKEAFSHSLGPDAPVIKVFEGAPKPLAGKAFTASYYHGKDGISGASELPNNPFPEAEGDLHPFEFVPPSTSDAAQGILDFLRDEPAGTVHIAAIGPLTNLAKAWQKDPVTFAKVGHISVMGGALELPGNTTPTSEFNFFADPYAAQVLTEIPANHPALKGKPLPLFLVPLDITHQHAVPYSRFVKDEAHLKTASPLSQFVTAFMRHPRQVTNSFAPPDAFEPHLHDNFIAHDPLAVVHAIFPNEKWAYQAREFLMETEGKYTRGMCIIDRRDHGPSHKGSNRAAGANTPEEDDEPRDIETAPEQELNGAALGSRPFPTQVLTGSPGAKWFSDLFLSRLTL